VKNLLGFTNRFSYSWSSQCISGADQRPKCSLVVL